VPKSFLDRYQTGECEAVWEDLVSLGPGVRHELYVADARAVARETMRRARRNVEMLIGKLEQLNYGFLDSYNSAHKELERLDKLEGAWRFPSAWLIESRESWRGYFALGMIEVYQTRSESPENVLQAIELAPEHKVAMLSDWGTALMGSGLLTGAYPKFIEASALDEKAFIPQVNMSAIRLRQARRGEPTLDQAVLHAAKAESLQAGTGAYNLACAAAQSRDRAGVEKWLTISAEHGYPRHRQTVVMDADFQSVVSELWFAELLDKLYPA